MLTVYTTCPQSTVECGAALRGPIVDVARWTEAAGLRGLLIFTDNETMDPWAAAQLIADRTERAVPLVAAQPVYMHPYTAARMVSTIGALYGRVVDLNFVTGGHRPDLLALGSTVDHDGRYDRLVEYGEVVTALLTTSGPLSYHGEYYQLTNARISPALPRNLAPRYFVSGSSPAAKDTAAELDTVRLTYARELAADDAGVDFARTGVRFGVIARDTSSAAWRVALRRYPPDSVRENAHAAVASQVESQWYRGLWRDSAEEGAGQGVYWLHPFRVGAQLCPFLVGEHEEVGEVLARYLRAGVCTLILATPTDEEDLHHAVTAVRHAERLAAAVASPVRGA